MPDLGLAFVKGDTTESDRVSVIAYLNADLDSKCTTMTE